jgi:hypothetical protein
VKVNRANASAVTLGIIITILSSLIALLKPLTRVVETPATVETLTTVEAPAETPVEITTEVTEVIKEIPMQPPAPATVRVTTVISAPATEPACPSPGYLPINVKIRKAPPKLTNKSDVLFSFVTDLVTDCVLDGKELESCRPPVKVNVQDGEHDFLVMIRDKNGCEVASTSYKFKVDTTPPETHIIPKDKREWIDTDRATFSIEANEPISKLLCRVDLSAWYECEEEVELLRLTDGRHLIRAVATDLAGNEDPTPAAYSWYVDTTPPETTIKSHPPKVISSQFAGFEFDSNERYVEFFCKLDDGEWKKCPSRYTVSNLSVGKHRLLVKAQDRMGRKDETPAEFMWDVTLGAP